MTISELLKVSVPKVPVTGVYMLESKELREAKNGNQYAYYTFTDATGTISGKQWTLTAAYDGLVPGSPVKISGVTNIFQGQTSISVNEIAQLKLSDLPLNVLKTILPSAPMSGKDATQEILDTASHFTDPALKAVVERAIQENLDAFETVPAAQKVHEACIGGLAYHTLMMLRTAKAIAEVYSLQTPVDKDLLYAGVCIHDIGKIREFALGPTGLVVDYTPSGNMLGHLFMGAEYIGKLADEAGMDPEKKLMLQHMILAHHGKPEYGACVKGPMFLEASLLHLVDVIDSEMWQFGEVQGRTDPGKMSERIFSLDGGRVYARQYTYPDPDRSAPNMSEPNLGSSNENEIVPDLFQEGDLPRLF